MPYDITGTASGGVGAGAFSNIGGGMGPLLLPALISGGSSLLGSIFSGIGKSQERKQAYKDWTKQRQTRIGDVEKYLKPQIPRYSMERDLSGIDPAFKKIILGRLTDILGNERLSKWGVDPTSLLANIGMQQPSPETSSRFGNMDIPNRFADNIMNKYGGRGGRGM